MKIEINVQSDALTAEEKNILENIMKKWLVLDDGKKSYVGGLVDGMAITKERSTN